MGDSNNERRKRQTVTPEFDISSSHPTLSFHSQGL